MSGACPYRPGSFTTWVLQYFRDCVSTFPPPSRSVNRFAFVAFDTIRLLISTRSEMDDNFSVWHNSWPTFCSLKAGQARRLASANGVKRDEFCSFNDRRRSRIKKRVVGKITYRTYSVLPIENGWNDNGWIDRKRKRAHEPSHCVVFAFCAVNFGCAKK